ncbi:MAG: glycosyltransferase family 2 protein [Lachnospiraceae bacterium]|nr:glycosyltransferase family 2 protein [Lachnospiraceae bacterium]
MKTTLIILNYKDSERTLTLLNKVREYRILDNIVIVDNASGDGSYESLKREEDGRIHVIEREENGGYSSGNNTGALYALKHFRPDILFFANPDVFFTEETAEVMAGALERNSGFASVAPLVRQGYNVWNLPGFPGVLMSLFLILFTLDKKRIRAGLERHNKELSEVGVVEGSFFAVDAGKFKEVQGFDERTFLYSEEIILARRFRAHGYKTGVLTRFRYDHLHSASIKKIYRSSKAAAFHHFRDSFRIYNKYYLKTNALEDRIFDICWGLGYAERVVYDLVLSS